MCRNHYVFLLTLYKDTENVYYLDDVYQVFGLFIYVIQELIITINQEPLTLKFTLLNDILL